MENFNLDKLMAFVGKLDYTLWGVRITDIFIAIFILLFAYFLKVQLSNLVIKNLKLITSKTKSQTDDKFLKIIEPPLQLSILIVGFYFAANWIDIKGFNQIALSIQRTLIVFTLFWALYRTVNEFAYIFKKFSAKFGKELSDDIANFIVKFLKVVVIALGAMTILDGWGINVSAFVASLGLVGMAFALAAKDTAANLFGSLVIFTDRPFRQGDWVQTPEVEGVIETIGIRSTRVRTFAQALVSVPNAVIANSPITNWSLMGKRRIKMRLGLTYSTNTEQLEAVLKDIREMLKNHPDIHPDVIMVYFDEFQDSSLSLFCYFFTKTTIWSQYLKVREDVNLRIMKIVENNGCSFAFPSQSIYVESLPKEQLI